MSSRKGKNVRVSMHGTDAVAGVNIPYHPHQFMLNGSKHDLINAKSQYEAEFRRFAIDSSTLNSVEKLHSLLGRLHGLNETEFYITYIDKTDGELLPINNDDNYAQALRSYTPPSVLRIHIQRKDQEGRPSAVYHPGRNSDPNSSRTPFRALLSRDNLNNSGGGGNNSSSNVRRRNQIQIGRPENFRPVSSIIDADILPETLRRVKMMKHNNERPLGFYIRDGVCVRPTSNGIEKVPGIYISRVVQGGLAESTGLLNVEDEVLEVNGIEVEGKTLDQVTDMMIANSSNLILTIKPANQSHVSWSGGAAAGGTMGDRSSSSKLSRGSAHSATSSSRSSGASGSLLRRGNTGGRSNENHAPPKPSKLVTSSAAALAASNGEPTTTQNGGGTSWGDAKFRTSQISQASSSASSSSMSIGGLASNGGQGHSPYDADEMDEVRDYPSNTAAVLEAIQRQQQRGIANNNNDYANNNNNNNVSPVVQPRRRDHHQRREGGDQVGVLEQGFSNPAFSEQLSQHADISTTTATSSGGGKTRSSRAGNATRKQHADDVALNSSSSRSSEMDMF